MKSDGQLPLGGDSENFVRRRWPFEAFFFCHVLPLGTCARGTGVGGPFTNCSKQAISGLLRRRNPPFVLAICQVLVRMTSCCVARVIAT